MKHSVVKGTLNNIPHSIHFPTIFFNSKEHRINGLNIIAFIIYLVVITISSIQANKEKYFNPWISLKHPTKILKFASNGNVKQENIAPSQTLTFKTTMPRLKRRNGDEPIKKSNYTIQELRDLFADMHKKLKPPARLKILTNCSQSKNFCRFLTCPRIEKYCTLCEVALNKKNETKCENISTKLLARSIFI